MNDFNYIINNLLHIYDTHKEKSMFRVPCTSTYKPLSCLSDEEINEYLMFFERITWKTAYDEAYILILKDYRIKKRYNKIIKLKNKIK